MTSITLIVTGARIRAEVNGALTSGMAGIPVSIQYDEAWNTLTKNLVCRCGKWGPDKGETRTVLNIGETATVAHEVMQADMHLYLGIEGYSTDGKLVMPTTWADCGVILHGANAGADSSTDPKQSVWAQLQAQIEQIKQASITEGEIAAAISAYLEENPIKGSDVVQNVVIDTTLTVEGAAADAKAVGDAIAEEAQVRLGVEDALMALQYAAVKSVNGTAPDADGNVEIIISDSSQNANCLLTVETITIGEAGDIPVTGITLDYNSISLNAGDSMMLAASVSPSNATNNKVLWVSNNTEVATVNNGYVTAVSAGNAVITAYSDENNAIKATCSVAVAAESGGDEPEVTLTGISATYSGGDVAVGTAVNDLTGIVVTSHYSDGTSEPVSGYTLSGTIVEGSNTITVSYGGRTTTFTVTGVAENADGRIQLSTLEIADGLPKKDGTVATVDGAHYVMVPYTDGIQIYFGISSGWAQHTYPSIIVSDGGADSYPEFTREDRTITVGDKIVTPCMVTLTGYSPDAIVRVSFMAGIRDHTLEEEMNLAGFYYYIPGGDV